jgi:hypothetical protein
MSIRLDVSNNQVRALVIAGFIDPAERNDPDEVAQGVCRSLALWTEIYSKDACVRKSSQLSRHGVFAAT